MNQVGKLTSKVQAMKRTQDTPEIQLQPATFPSFMTLQTFPTPFMTRQTVPPPMQAPSQSVGESDSVQLARLMLVLQYMGMMLAFIFCR